MNIHDKILQLRSKVPERGATEDEALASLKMADKLMAEYGITEAGLAKVQVARDMRGGTHAQRQKVQHPSSKWCLVAIGKFTKTRVWYDKRLYNPQIFGMISDVEMAEFLLELVHDSMNRGWKDFLASNSKVPGVSRHTQYWSFMMGFAARINDKIDELVEARRTNFDSTGTDLVVVQMALVDAGLNALVPGLKLKKPAKKGIRTEGGAYHQGSAAGDRVNLSRPIKGSASRRAIA